MRKKAVPVGIEDFKRIIKEDYYYVDKTILIRVSKILCKLKT